MNQLKGRYSKISYSKKNLFYDPPATSIQDIICTRTNDTSTDIKYPSTRFEYIKNLGDGSASTIFQGFDKETNEKVIIKRISKREYWRKELEILKHLQNSISGKILKFIDFYESQRNSFIVTEFYPGFDLFEHIDINVPYSEEKGIKIIREMAKCIKECHDNNIIHLDIKCENYMVKTDKIFNGEESSIVLIDFGHSEIFKLGENIEKLRRGYNYGTSLYLCPEGYFEKIFSSKSDIWSLAVCMTLLITGDYPFLGNKKEYYQNSIVENICFSKEISEKSKELLKDALSIYPKKRPNINQFIDRLNEILLRIV